MAHYAGSALATSGGIIHIDCDAMQGQLIQPYLEVL